MKKVRIGVMGAYRGTSMINYCESSQNAQVVAICDKWAEGLERQKAALNDPAIAYYTDFDDFIRHDMDAFRYVSLIGTGLGPEESGR